MLSAGLIPSAITNVDSDEHVTEVPSVRTNVGCKLDADGDMSCIMRVDKHRAVP